MIVLLPSLLDRMRLIDRPDVNPKKRPHAIIKRSLFYVVAYGLNLVITYSASSAIMNNLPQLGLSWVDIQV